MLGDSKDWTEAALQREGSEGCSGSADRTREGQEDLTKRGFPQVAHSAPPVLARGSAQSQSTDLESQQLLPDIPGVRSMWAWPGEGQHRLG